MSNYYNGLVYICEVIEEFKYNKNNYLKPERHFIYGNKLFYRSVTYAI